MIADGVPEPHWSPYHSLCSPCSLDYDWVLKLGRRTANSLSLINVPLMD